jgi:hypothetical protein
MEKEARSALPLRERAGRAISVLAGYAMRPQLAMAALLLLMIGSSFLFLRSKPGGSDSVLVTERGIQEADESVAIVPLPEKPERYRADESRDAAQPEPATAARPDEANEAPGLGKGRGEETDAEAEPVDVYAQAMGAYRKGQYKLAEQQFDEIAYAGGPQAASAGLYAAHSARNSSGCSKAAAKFDGVRATHIGTNVGNEAAWHAASCYRELGQSDRARQHYRSLLEVAAYAERAQHALDKLDVEGTTAVAARSAAAKPAAKSEAEAKTKAKPAKAAQKPAAPAPVEADQGFE